MKRGLQYLLLTLLVAAFFVSPSYAQNRQITGKVSDENGAGLPGANVLIKGTTRGTTSDADGGFSIGVSAGESTLIISSVGYMPKEVSITPTMTTLQISLEPDVKNLGEVVVTALGIERSAKSLTYATQQISGKQLTDVRDANFVNTLSGKVAGIVVTQGSSGPGSATRVVLRGNRSISGNNNALFVVDGVPIDNTVQGQVGNDFGGTNGSDGASNINPDDIESMNVLKGAAASALYGSRAANGVVMITTKKGKAGAVTANINSGVVVENPFLLPEFQNTYGQGAGGATSTAYGSWGPATTTFPDNVKNFFRTGVSTNNSFGISAGTDKVQTYTSYAYNAVQGIIPNNSLQRHTFNVRIGTQLTKRFSTDAKITYVNQDIKNKPKSGEESGLVMNVYKVPRSVDLDTYKTYENEAGEPVYWTSSSIYMNPYWTMNKTSDDEKRNRITALGSAKYNLTDWLNVQGRISYDRYDDRVNRSWANRTLLFAGPGGSYQDFSVAILEKNLDVIVSGNNKIGENFALTYNFGAGQTYKRYSQVGANANGLLVPNKFDLSFAASLSQIANFNEKELHYVFGTASFSYKDFFTVDAAARNDWSSTLPKPYSFFYPSFGANLILTEAFQLPNFISFAKIRGSWAQVGNDTDPYLLSQTYTFTQGGTGGYVYRDPTQPATNLKPEISSSTEFGLDLRMFGGKLGLDLTYYNSNTVNQLLSLSLAPASGFSQQFINAGKINNKGFELSVTAKAAKTDNFSWDVTLNLARNKNTIVRLDPNVKRAFLGGGFGRTATPIVEEGGSYGDMIAQRWMRDDQGRFVVTTPDSAGNNGGKPVVSKEFEHIGNFNPKFTAGLNNSFSYKRFTASFLIDGRFGGVMTSGTAANLAFDGTGDFTTDHREGGWVLPGVTSTGEANTTPINAETFWTTVSGGRYSWGEFFTYSATNVRLRELSVGYDIPTGQGFFIKSARLSFIARNLFFIYRGSSTLDIPGEKKRKLPFDPDVNLGAGNFQGIEYGNLPSTRTVGLNLKLGF
ncbi:SusC/RagA family TonB-linked outer membrane protein [Dyadobacter chenhuakuii]|uniref:SusC/RagA family TonB-linked outer membrane protein n=1 Tax=Dyadobacter chenhuakuii TaxID=2909339 RepID=A0ABY4XSY5_9BACT|nr:SusC/RagA family TonB-linked outer membrane protein [Dyadobacter chenhuakuii]MCF2492169.1 SusC/RagA family TonB-linked outer membrane protein [Dyadobacter chenhuakuii]USJ33522.1 SusC/RagA family TonB-linked outer membrane protein [Dyadobacter chenhuakuii]